MHHRSGPPDDVSSPNSRPASAVSSLRPFLSLLSAGFLLLLAACALADTPNPQQDPNGFVRDVLHHEVQAQLQDHALWSYDEVKKEDGKAKHYSVYQTQQGEIDRLVAVNGQPISEKEAHAEDARINKLIKRPGEMRQEQKKKAEDGERARGLLKMFPDAFLFQYEGTEGHLVKLKFTPNPEFRAESHPAQVFHHLAGTMVFDSANKRLITIDGKLMSEVKFGGGWLGHLDPGGVFHVKQEEVSSGYWEVTLMRVEMKGKALFFKTIGAHNDETYTEFHRVPDTTSPQQAAAEVRKNAAGN